MHIIHYLDYEPIAIAERNAKRAQAKRNAIKKTIVRHIRDFFIILLMMSPLLGIALITL